MNRITLTLIVLICSFGADEDTIVFRRGYYNNRNYEIVSYKAKYRYNGSLKFEITAKRLYAASQRVL